MTQNELAQTLARKYLLSRPNSDSSNPDLSVFFLACPGSGKSTIRKVIVERLKATYVSNDEVRELLAQDPEAQAKGVTVKQVIDLTYSQLLSRSNRLIVFDHDVSHYHMHKDSYLNRAKARNAAYIITIDVPESELINRVKTRQRDVENLLESMAVNLRHLSEANKALTADFTLKSDDQVDDLIASLSRALTRIHNT